MHENFEVVVVEMFTTNVEWEKPLNGTGDELTFALRVRTAQLIPADGHEGSGKSHSTQADTGFGNWQADEQQEQQQRWTERTGG